MANTPNKETKVVRNNITLVVYIKQRDAAQQIFPIDATNENYKKFFYPS